MLSWVCCVDSWRLFFSIYEVYMWCVSILSDSKNSNVACFVLEMQERGELACYSSGT